MATSEPQIPAHEHITIIGGGTIGLSFAALHLLHNPTATITVHDTRPDLSDQITTHLHPLLPNPKEPFTARLHTDPNLSTAVRHATIIQEQGPENPTFKRSLWPQIETHAPPNALLWSSTSGIPASTQSTQMRDPSRLLVVHPYNPPHIMPLLEVVPSSLTSALVIERTMAYWTALGRAPVLLKKECTGFVSNRLAFALLREACSLVASGVVGVEEVDEIVRTSMGPRWAVAGPFKAYHAGGGEGGLQGFMEKIGGTVQECWDASERGLEEGGVVVGGEWQGAVCERAEEVYGRVDLRERDERTRKVLEAASGHA